MRGFMFARATSAALGLMMFAAGCREAESSAPASAAPSATTSASTAPRPLSLPAGTYALDPVHTFVSFAAQHEVVGKVVGRFDNTTGSVVVAADPAACSVDATMDTASVNTHNPVRDQDLRSASFFDTAKFPAGATYRGRGLRRSDGGWVMDGALTIRGVTRTTSLTIEFEGTAPPKPGKPARVAFHATAAVKRADFEMTRDILEELGAASDGPDVLITIEAELLAAPTAQ